jgi:ABC-type bacteriocin/lantibiotic exporter with double-glycine peptidase domain
MVTYFEQETPYTCGPACMRMVLSSLGIKKTEKQVTKLLGTNKIRGTNHRDFVSLAEKYKLRYSVNRDSSLDDLKYYLKKGYRIIVCYFHTIGREGHYAVIKSMNARKITLMDPIDGPSKVYSLSYFNQMWKSNKTYEGERSWFMAIKR